MKKLISLAMATLVSLSLLSACAPAAPEAPAEDPAAEAPASSVVTDAVTDAIASAGDLPDASGDDKVTIIFSGASTQSANESEDVFKQVVEELSGGSIVIDWHPFNELGGDLDGVTNVQFGDIGMAISSPAPLTTMMPNMSIFDAYYLINTQDQAYSVMDGTIGETINANAEAIGLKIVAWCENGWRNLTSNKDVGTIADLDGLKVRTMENALQMASWKALGANPTPMSFGEVYTALQQGTIEGQENPIGLIDSSSFMEIQDYLVLSKHVYTPLPWFINLDLYNSMTDSQKAVFDYAAQYAETFQRERNIELEGEILAKFEAEGKNIVALDEATVASFTETIQAAGVYDEVKAAMTNPELLDTLIQ